MVGIGEALFENSNLRRLELRDITHDSTSKVYVPNVITKTLRIQANESPLLLTQSETFKQRQIKQTDTTAASNYPYSASWLKQPNISSGSTQPFQPYRLNATQKSHIKVFIDPPLTITASIVHTPGWNLVIGTIDKNGSCEACTTIKYISSGSKISINFHIMDAGLVLTMAGLFLVGSAIGLWMMM
jgi:hypothetical protein